jgi:hypothetical protein
MPGLSSLPRCVVALAALGLLSPVHAQDPAAAADSGGGHPLFADSTPLTLMITGPFRLLSRDGRQRPQRDAVLTYRDLNGQETSVDVRIRIRGKSRLEVCSFPPLRLNFKRKQLDATVFAGQNRLKLATLCKPTDEYRDWLTQEYQIYLMFNALTKRSFRVRWLEVEYGDTDERRGRTFTEPAFVIEEDWEVAERNGMEVAEPDNRIELPTLARRHTALLALFQYMIGNTDWAATQGPEGEPCCHNGKVVVSDAGERFVIPYDFDQAGLIDTSYASPNPQVSIRSVRERLYRGYCPMNDELDWAVARLNEQRSAIEAILREGPVSANARDRALAYLGESYSIINDPDRFRKEIVEGCRG